MQPHTIRFDRGVVTRDGYDGPRGTLRLARNMRYRLGSPRLWQVLGRDRFNADVIPAAVAPTTDEETCKNLFVVHHNNGTRRLIAHKGGTLHEASLQANAEFTTTFNMADDSNHVTPRGWVSSFRDTFFYIMRHATADGYAFARRAGTGWRNMGHDFPDDTFTAAATGSGAFTSSTEIKYLFRIYDSTTDTESARSVIVSVAAFSNVSHVLLTWASGITQTRTDLGTHVRIYRTGLGEPAGVFYRVDGAGSGITIGSFTPGFTWQDTTTNTTARLQGTVRSDGVEGEEEWAEHGGPPPRAGGQLLFRNQMIWWDVEGRTHDILYSPVGYPEQCPVDYDLDYAYYLEMSTDKQDEVKWCGIAGTYVVALLGTSMWRIASLPTFAQPGFDRLVQEPISTEDGVVGKRAACSFGLADDQQQLVLYVSPVNGLCVTDGFRKYQVVKGFDFLSLVEPRRWDDIECVDYPSMQEVRIYYSPVGIQDQNTKALVLNYSLLDGNPRAYRITYPLDVKCMAATYGVGTDDVRRHYVLTDDKHVYVEDQGTVDDQDNLGDASNDFQFDVETARYRDQNSHMMRARRVFVQGGSDTAGDETWSVEHYALDGQEEYKALDTVRVGPGEGAVDSYNANLTGQAHRIRLHRKGSTGSSYEAGANQASSLREATLEVTRQGRQRQTRGTGVVA